MKALALLILLAGSSQAIPPSGQNRPRESISGVTLDCSDGDQFGIDISSNLTGVTPSSFTIASTLIVNGSTAPWKSVMIQNQGLAGVGGVGNIYFGYSQYVSSISLAGVGEAYRGFKIAPGNIPQSFPLIPSISYYVITDSTTGSVPIVVSTCK